MSNRSERDRLLIENVRHRRSVSITQPSPETRPKMAHSHQIRSRRRARRQHDGAKVEDIVERVPKDKGGTVLSIVYVTATPTFSGSIAGYTTITDTPQQTGGSSGGDQQITPEEGTQQQTTQQQQQQQQQQQSSQQTTTQPPQSTQSTQPTPSAQSAPPIQSSQSVTQAQSTSPLAQQVATTSLGQDTQQTQTPSSADSFVTTSTLDEISSQLTSITASESSIISSSALGPLGVATASTTLLSSFSSSTKASLSTFSGAEATASAPNQAASMSIATGGMSGGAKVGVAIAILLAVLAVAAGVLYFYWKKKKEVEDDQAADHEKAPFDAMRPTMASDRPSEKMAAANPASAALALGPGASRHITAQTDGQSPWERRAYGPKKVNDPFRDPNNPFDDQARAASSPRSLTTSDAGSGAADAMVARRPSTAVGKGAAGLAARAVNAAGTVSKMDPMSRGLSNETGSPGGKPAAASGVPGTVAAAVAIGTATTVGGSAPSTASKNNVHRVQLAFTPSMDDELELEAGQLVRILHEYDDGWVGHDES